MLAVSVLIALLPVFGLAGDSGGATWCAISDPRGIPDYVCLSRISDQCFACLGPVETAAGDEGADPLGFAQRFCPDPAIKQGTSWNAIEKCFTGSNPSCVPDDMSLFNAYGVTCVTSPQPVRDVWKDQVCRADATGNAVLQGLQKYNCDGTTPTVTVPLSTKIVSSTATASVSVTSSTVTAVTSKPAGSSTTSAAATETKSSGSGTSAAITSSVSGTGTQTPKPTTPITAGASGSATVNVAAAVLGVLALVF